MKNALSAAMVLIGTFIGAGFASGREVYQYFGIFGKYGGAGIAISCIILGLFTYCTADNIQCLGEEVYIERICNFRWVKWFFNCYMLLIFCTMITAFGECLHQAFDFPKIYGVILIDFVAIIILYFGAEGLIKFNTFVTPVIVSGIFFALISEKTVNVFAYNNFVTSSVVYTSYNIISLPFVMSGMKKIFSSRKTIAACATIFGGIIFLLAVCVLKLLNAADVNDSIPILGVVSKNYVYVFILVLAMSMLTTAVANGYGFMSAVAVCKKHTLPFLGLFAILFSLFSFSFVVKYLYGFFGYMGIYILLINFYIFIKNREKPRKVKKNSNKLI